MADNDPRDERALLVVARGQRSLLVAGLGRTGSCCRGQVRHDGDEDRERMSMNHHSAEKNPNLLRP